MRGSVLDWGREGRVGRVDSWFGAEQSKVEVGARMDSLSDTEESMECQEDLHLMPMSARLSVWVPSVIEARRL